MALSMKISQLHFTSGHLMPSVPCTMFSNVTFMLKMPDLQFSCKYRLATMTSTTNERI